MKYIKYIKNPIDLLLSKFISKYNGHEVKVPKVPKTEFKSLTKEICNELHIFPIYEIPPSSKYATQKDIKQKENFISKKEEESMELSSKNAKLRIKKNKSTDKDLRAKIEQEIELIEKKIDSIYDEVTPLKIEISNLLRKETHEKSGTSFSYNATSDVSKLDITSCSYIYWDVNNMPTTKEHIQKLENLVGYPKENIHMYRDYL